MNYSDPSGNSIIGSILLGAAIGAIVGGGVTLACELIENDGDWERVNWDLVIVDAVFGAIDGALSTMGLSLFVSLLMQPALAGLQTIIGAMVSDEMYRLSAGDVIASMAFSALMIGASAALSHYYKIHTGYNTFEHHEIRKVSNGYLKTAKSDNKIGMYQGKIAATRALEFWATLGYVGFTTLSNFTGWGLRKITWY